MKILLLCIDAIDYKRVMKWGIPKLEYNCKLEIPRELYHKRYPHSLKIWPSMMSGRIIDTPIWNWKQRIKYYGKRIGARFFKLFGMQKVIDKAKGVKKLRQSTSWRIRTDNVGIETVFDGYDSLIWNIPTICPECLMHYPSVNDMIEYEKREFEIWKYVVLGMARSDYEIVAPYVHILDGLGHAEQNVLKYYVAIDRLIELLKELNPDKAIIVVGDHGMEDGKHTEYAYMGSTEQINAKSVMDVRREIERILDD